MRRATWLPAVLFLTAAAAPTLGVGPAEPYPGLPRYVVASPVGRPGAWEVTPEQLEAEGLPSYAAALRAPGTYVPLNDTAEQQRFFDAVKAHNFSLLFNGTYYGGGSTHADGPGGACCYEVSFNALGRRDPAPWRTTAEALRAEDFPFVARAIERGGVDLPITERTDEALRFVKALRQRGASQLEAEGQQYLVGFRDPPFPPPDPGEKSYAILLRVVQESPPAGAPWTASPEDLERRFLLGHAAALAAPGKHVGASDCRAGVCPGIAAFNAALRDRNATHLRWNGTDYVVRYVTTGAGGVPGESLLQFVSQGVYVHASDEAGTFWLASPDDLARAGMPTIGEALSAPGRFFPFPEGGADEVQAYKFGLRQREAVHLRHAERLWEVKFGAEWRLLAPNQTDTAVSLGPTVDQDEEREPEAPGGNRGGNLTAGPSPVEQATPLPTILVVIALLLAARRWR